MFYCFHGGGGDGTDRKKQKKMEKNNNDKTKNVANLETAVLTVGTGSLFITRTNINHCIAWT